MNGLQLTLKFFLSFESGWIFATQRERARVFLGKDFFFLGEGVKKGEV